MAIKPRKALKMRPQSIPPALLKYFRGEPYTASDQGAGDVFLMELRPGMRKLWEEYRNEVLPDWISKNPCTRPFGFWKFDAPELRKQINGSGSEDYERDVINSEGLPMYWQLEWDTSRTLIFESQAAFLKRHGLLTPAEKRWLAAHKDALEPEAIEFDNED